MGLLSSIAGVLTGPLGAAAVEVGGGLVGSVLNSKAQKKANRANSPAGQVAQFEAAGINPLFGLSSGSYRPQSAVAIGDAFAGAGSSIRRGLELQHETELRETAIEKENEQLKEALDDLVKVRVPSHLKTSGGFLPLPKVGEVRTNESPVDDNGSATVGDANGGLESTPFTVTSPQDLGSGTFVNPRVADAELSETRYGDVTQEVAGARVLIEDNKYNDRLKNLTRWYGGDFAAEVHKRFAQPPYEKSLNQIIDGLVKERGIKKKHNVRQRPKH